MEKAIYIKAAKAGYKLPVGCSQWWGSPDLPKAMAYPTYLDSAGRKREYKFVCQINLEEVALHCPDTRLPHKGLLSFFARIHHYLGDAGDTDHVRDRIGSPEEVRVFYFEQTEELEEVVLLDKDGKETDYPEMRMTLSTQQEKYAADQGLFLPPTHREWETWAPPFETWKVLFQLDSFEGDHFHLNFMGSGVLDFLIAPEDLEAHRFDRVRAIVLKGK